MLITYKKTNKKKKQQQHTTLFSPISINCQKHCYIQLLMINDIVPSNQGFIPYLLITIESMLCMFWTCYGYQGYVTCYWACYMPSDIHNMGGYACKSCLSNFFFSKYEWGKGQIGEKIEEVLFVLTAFNFFGPFNNFLSRWAPSKHSN